MRDVGRHRGGGVSRHAGRWRARARIDGKTVSLGLFDSREDAERAVREALRQVRGGDVLLPGALTLGEWGLEWLDRRERGGLVRGIAQERSAWRTHVADAPIAVLRLRDVTRPMIVRWLDALVYDTRKRVPVRGGESRVTDTPLAKQTVANTLQLVRGALRAAVDAGHLEASPAETVRMPRVQRQEEAAWTWLTPDEITRVLGTERMLRGRPGGQRTREVEIPAELRCAWAVAIYAGLRRGEVRALRWCDVRLDADPQLVIRRSHDGPTKSGKPREVPLLPPAVEAIERMRELRPGIGSACVWRPRGGGRMMPATWDLGWRRWGEPLVGRHVRVHDLRHTCASHLIQGTWGRAFSLPEVALWLGHSATSVTERYAHLAPDGLRGAAREMARTWREEMEP